LCDQQILLWELRFGQAIVTWTSLAKLGGCLAQILISEALSLICTGWQSRHLLIKIDFMSGSVRSAAAGTGVSAQEHTWAFCSGRAGCSLTPSLPTSWMLLWNSALSSLLHRSVSYPNENSTRNFVCTFVVRMPDNVRRIRNLLCEWVGTART